MRKFALVAIVVLAGCQMTADQRGAFDKACSTLRLAYAVYSQAHPGGPTPKVQAAYTIADRACTNPPLDLVTATAQVALAVYTISRLTD